MGAIARLREHPKGFWFVFFGELAERASYYGMRTVLAVYIVDRLRFSQANASVIGEIFMAACYLFCLPGGWIADRFLGRYKTIVYFFFPYVFGQLLLGSIQTTFALYVSLFLLAVGSGTIKPSCSPLMGMIYEKQGKEHLIAEAFTYYYAAINIGSAITTIAVPALRNYLAPPPGPGASAAQLAAFHAALPHAYFVTFLLPAALMTVALGIFALGKRHYVVETVNREKKTEEQRAAEWNSLKRVAPVFGLIVFFWFVYDQSATTWIFFARDHMDLTLLHFGSWRWSISAEQIQAINPFAILFLTPVFNWRWERARKKNGGAEIPDTRRMMEGFVVVIACMAIMALAGYAVGTTGRVTAWLEVVATLVISYAELGVSSIGLKFAFEQAAPNTKSFITSAFLVTVFIGDFCIGAPFVKLWGKLSPGTYFAIQTGVMLVVALIFRGVARHFERQSDGASTAAAAA